MAFLARAHHAIGNQMNTLLGFAQLLQRDRDLTPRQREHVETIQQSGERLLALITNIVEIARTAAGRIDVDSGAPDLSSPLADLEAMLAGKAALPATSGRAEPVRHGAESDKPLTGDDLLSLPAALTAEIHEAAINGDFSQVATLAQQVEAVNPGLAGQLREMAKRFDFQRLLDLFDRRGESHGKRAC